MIFKSKKFNIVLADTKYVGLRFPKYNISFLSRNWMRIILYKKILSYLRYRP